MTTQVMHGNDTIVALASGAGRAGIAVIRVSGPHVRFITETIAGLVPVPRHAELRTLRQSGSDLPLDQALVLFFDAPRSFTGEDIVEFHCHGSRAVTKAIINQILNLGPDIRLAEPGEFARRAFLNGKMDLTAIEGLGDLIDSETEWQRRQSFRQMDGELGRLVQGWRGELLQAMAYIEATIDFSDEGDVDVDLADVTRPLIALLRIEMLNVLKTADFGERLREGFRVVIAGPPNAGKSSLINAIARRDVALVSELPGTTRDVIELRCDIGGYPVIFSDTAGLRETSDELERMGIYRARIALEGADVVLNLHAVGEPALSEAIRETSALTIATKIDIGMPTFPYDIAISAKSGAGILTLLSAIENQLDSMGGGETALIANARQHHAIMNAIAPLDRLQHSFDLGAQGSLQPELVAEELRQVTQALDQLVGRIDVEMVLDTLFARFCIGK